MHSKLNVKYVVLWLFTLMIITEFSAASFYFFYYEISKLALEIGWDQVFIRGIDFSSHTEQELDRILFLATYNDVIFLVLGIIASLVFLVRYGIHVLNFFILLISSGLSFILIKYWFFGFNKVFNFFERFINNLTILMIFYAAVYLTFLYFAFFNKSIVRYILSNNNNDDFSQILDR